MKNLIIAGLTIFAAVMVVNYLSLATKYEKVVQPIEAPIKAEIVQEEVLWEMAANRQRTLDEMTEAKKAEVEVLNRQIAALEVQGHWHNVEIKNYKKEMDRLRAIKDKARER